MAETKLDIKLLVDKKRNKVVFAECGKDFVDVLISFLTLPLGTVVRILHKQSDLGSMDCMYSSVEKLDNDYFVSQACKSMLLRPRSPVEYGYRNLVLKVDDNNGYYYLCPNWTCITETHRLISMFPDAKCLCGNTMHKRVSSSRRKEVSNINVVTGDDDKLEGVFVNGIRKFVIGDDLKLRPVTAETRFSMFVEFGINDGSALEEKDVSVGMKEVLCLLKRSMFSKTAMSDVFLSMNTQLVTLRNVKCEPKQIKSEPTRLQPDMKKMSLNLVIRKSTKKILYAASTAEFFDFLLGFLAFPMASIINLSDNFSAMNGMGTLYKSVQDLYSVYAENFQKSKCIISGMTVMNHHTCKNNFMQMEEYGLRIRIVKCKICFDEATHVCKHGLGRFYLNVINPKYKETVTESGKGFVKGSAMFMITDNLVVEPLSPISAVSFVNKQGVAVSDIEERTVNVGKQEALLILKASLTSKTVLSDVFCQ